MTPHPPPPADGRPRLEAALLLGYLALFAGGLASPAGRQLLWYDELFTVYLARIGSPAELYRQLAGGVDLNPPLIYLLTGAGFRAFGESELTARLPAIAGGVLACLSVYLFVRHRRPAAEAWVGATAVTVSDWATPFLIEARPYGLLCGWAALSLLCWQRAADPAGCSRAWWRAALAVAFGAGMATHYYFALVVAAVGAGEAVRTLVRWSVDWRMAVCFAVPVAVLAGCSPLVAAGREYAPNFWAKAELSPHRVQRIYAETVKGPAVAAVTIGLAVAFAAGSVRRAAPAGPGGGYPVWEAVAVAAVVALPAAGLVAGWLSGGFTLRYVIPVSVGGAILLAGVIGRTAGNWWGCAAVALLFAYCGPARAAVWPGAPAEPAHSHALDLAPALAGHRDGTMIFEDAHDFLGWHYYDPRLAGVFVADPAAARRHGAQDTDDRGVAALARVTPLPVVGLDEVAGAIGRGERYYYCGAAERRGWLVREFEARGVRLTPVATAGARRPRTLYRMETER